MLLRFFKIFLFLFIIIVLALSFFGFWGYNYITRDLPDFSNINHYDPPLVSSIYAKDKKTLIGEVYSEKRYFVPIKQIPKHVIKSFLAAEDASFYHHPGIDPFSILRALIVNIRTQSEAQGGSTITQQVVKNILLTREKKYERKIKEAILSYKLEKELSKDQILEIYLNHIFFGNSSYGIQAASLNYFNKSVEHLSIAETSILAGLPQAPSKYSPVKDLYFAKKRQKYVLQQMLKLHYIDNLEYDKALKSELKIYKAINKKIIKAPYYVSEVIKEIESNYQEFLLEEDGLKVYTNLDLKAYELADKSLKRGLKQIDKRNGWRGEIGFSDTEIKYFEKYKNHFQNEIKPLKIYPTLILEVNKNKKEALVLVGNEKFVLGLSKTWINKFYLDEENIKWIEPLVYLKKGMVVETSFQKVSKDSKFEIQFDQTPKVQGALVLTNPHTGEVPAIIGGFDFDLNQYNRATQSKRQPGSAFKPIIYLSAVDKLNYYPTTIVSDTQRTFKSGSEYWAPNNYDKKYLGKITLRTALEKSRNIVSANLLHKVGISDVIDYAKKMGIKSKLGYNLSLSLGSSEVTPFELVQSYGVFATNGKFKKSSVINKIEDRAGNVIFDSSKIEPKQVVSEESAFIMSQMLKGVVDSGTAVRVKKIGREMAGKTGTSNNFMDAWFVGFNPEWVCGVWVGFDLKKKIGDKETGSRAAIPIWINFMDKFLNYDDSLKARKKVDSPKFIAPKTLTSYKVLKSNGRLTESNSGSIIEYFRGEDKPKKNVYHQQDQDLNYWESEDF